MPKQTNLRPALALLAIIACIAFFYWRQQLLQQTISLQPTPYITPMQAHPPTRAQDSGYKFEIWDSLQPEIK